MKCLNCLESHTGFKDINNSCFCLLPNQKSEDKNYFSQTSIFLSNTVANEIREVVITIEKLIKSQNFKKKVFQEKYDLLKDESINGGILSCYDFHLVDNTPKLIEINTNAGGIFLNYQMLQKEEKCCAEVKMQNIQNFEEKIVQMFQKEFSKEESEKLKTVAIVDLEPTKQFLYQDVLICKEILERNNIQTYILDPKELQFKDGAIYFGEIKIDLMYNRLTDFYFESSDNKKFLESKNTIISPNHLDHLLFADKRNLILFQDDNLLSGVLTKHEVEIIRKSVPNTVLVSGENEDGLWENKKKYFFKPLNGYGGKGAYNGKGLTKKVWNEIKSSQYIAQEIVPPSVRLVNIDGNKVFYKFDIRVYTYNGEVLLLAARLYSGQTTNFRTKGGGFTPIFLTEA